jgi:hypothetical protein
VITLAELTLPVRPLTRSDRFPTKKALRHCEIVERYCRYVGCLITANGVAAATGIHREVVRKRLYRMGKAGVLRRSLHIKRPNGTVTIWEYAA